jgi:uncharacterized protein (TIGR03083 family)
MEPAEYLDVLQHEATSLLAAARAADPAAPVPGCPEWTTTDLVWHIGGVHDFWGYVVRERSMMPAGYEDPAMPIAPSPDETFEAVHTFASERAAELHRVLSATDPATPVWSWTPKQDVEFVIRRMAHETAAHRIDAEHVTGREHRLDPAFAADGVDEFLAYFLTNVRNGTAPLAGSVHLHCTDESVPEGAGEWTIRPGEGAACVVSRDHAKADTALRGEAHDLLMVLWRRAPLDAVTVFGDEALAQAFVGRAGTE